MSPSFLESAETQWLAQLTAMREALAELKSSAGQQQDETLGYGHDIVLDDEDTSSDICWSDEVWDIESEEREVSQDDVSAFLHHESSLLQDGLDRTGYGPEWLEHKCVEFAVRHPGMLATELKEQISALLVSDSSGKTRLCPYLTMRLTGL